MCKKVWQLFHCELQYIQNGELCWSMVGGVAGVGWGWGGFCGSGFVLVCCGEGGLIIIPKCRGYWCDKASKEANKHGEKEIQIGKDDPLFKIYNRGTKIKIRQMSMLQEFFGSNLWQTTRVPQAVESKKCLEHSQLVICWSPWTV